MRRFTSTHRLPTSPTFSSNALGLPLSSNDRQVIAEIDSTPLGSAYSSIPSVLASAEVATGAVSTAPGAHDASATIVYGVVVYITDEFQIGSVPGEAFNAASQIGATPSTISATAVVSSAQVPPKPGSISGITSIPRPSLGSVIPVFTINGSTKILFPLVLNAGSGTGGGGSGSGTYIGWRFVDLNTGVSYAFEISPSQEDMTYSKNVVWANRHGPNDRTLIYEGQDKPRELSISGSILSQEQYETMMEWFDTRDRVYVIDDLGRNFLVYIREFSPVRERKFSHSWYHTYTMRAVILSG